jgi:beta-lactamase class D
MKLSRFSLFILKREFLMKFTCLVIVLFTLISCSTGPVGKKSPEKVIIQSAVYSPELQEVIDSANVTGSVLVYDQQNNTFWSNDFARCDSGFLPASTFKIPNSIIALETGVVANDSTLFKWNGEKRRLQAWEQDLTFTEAFRVSCVPCYQEIARKIGPLRMNEYLKKLNYGKMKVDSSNIDVFWLEGESRISMNQQLDFIARFYNKQLPVSDRTRDILKRMMVIEDTGKYVFSGKTGWSIRNGNNNGWFVGYLETKGGVYFVVTNIEPREKFNMDLFPKIRTRISLEAFKKLKILD